HSARGAISGYVLSSCGSVDRSEGEIETEAVHDRLVGLADLLQFRIRQRTPIDTHFVERALEAVGAVDPLPDVNTLYAELLACCHRTRGRRRGADLNPVDQQPQLPRHPLEN